MRLASGRVGGLRWGVWLFMEHRLANSVAKERVGACNMVFVRQLVQMWPLFGEKTRDGGSAIRSMD